MREEAREFRLISTALGSDRRVRTRDEEEEKLSQGSIETIHQQLFATLDLLRKSLGLQTCALLWLDPAGEKLKYYYSNVERGLTLRRYWTTACQGCPIKSRCTTGPQRRITRWEHEDVLEAVQRRLDLNPGAMRQRREVVEHPFGTIKLRMGAVHFLMKRLPKVRGEMALHVLAYNLTRVLNILGIQPLMTALRA